MNILIKGIFSLLMLSPFFALCQPHKNLTDPKGLKQGLWEEALDSSKIGKKQIVYFEIANYLNDTLHGSYTLLAKGKITYEATYFKGGLIDYERYYNDNGNLRKLIHRQSGKVDLELKFYSNGKVKEESYFLNDGVQNIRNYYTNGKIRLISYYLNNELEGKEYYYKKNGKLRMIIEYDHGRVIRVLK